MRITAVETVRPSIQPNLVFVLLHTNDGRTGLGEAFFGGRTVEAYLHESAAEVLLGAADPTPESMARALASYTGFAGAGVETRGNGAIDLALWDLIGQEAGLPLVRLFGGPVQESLPTYNTCAGPDTSVRVRGNDRTTGVCRQRLRPVGTISMPSSTARPRWPATCGTRASPG